MDANLTTDTVELDELETLDETSTTSGVNLPIVGVAIIGGALIGKFLAPPVGRFVKGLFSKSEPAEVLEIEAAPETPESEAV